MIDVCIWCCSVCHSLNASKYPRLMIYYQTIGEQWATTTKSVSTRIRPRRCTRTRPPYGSYWPSQSYLYKPRVRSTYHSTKSSPCSMVNSRPPSIAFDCEIGLRLLATLPDWRTLFQHGKKKSNGILHGISKHINTEYDHLFRSSFLILFEIVSLEGLINDVQAATSITGSNTQP